MKECVIEQKCTIYIMPDADNQNWWCRLRCRLNISSEFASASVCGRAFQAGMNAYLNASTVGWKRWNLWCAEANHLRREQQQVDIMSMSYCWVKDIFDLLHSRLSLFIIGVMVWQATFESMEADLKEMNNGVETLERNLVELQELHYVLRYTDPFFIHVSSLNFKWRD